MTSEQVIIVGAGPCGLATAAACLKRGIVPLVIDKGCIVNSVYHYPTFLRFHSTPELLEIGDIPFITPHEKPTRQEGLQYYTTVVDRLGIRVRTYEKVITLSPVNERFDVVTQDRFGREQHYETDNVVLATGYFDQPNRLGISGEQLPKVNDQFREAHPYYGRKVAIVGGRNSAVDAALELQRVGAEVTVIYRGSQLSDSVKSWVKPLFESAVAKGLIRMMWNTSVTEIREYEIVVEVAGAQEVVANDDVLVLTGYQPDRSFLSMVGIAIDQKTGAPVFNEETMETNVSNAYIAGVIAAGRHTNEIFIENGRHHGELIAQTIASRTP